MRLVLASASPARLAVLREAGVEPEVRVSGVDEDAVSAGLRDPSPAELVTALATAKADAVAATVDGDAVVIGCDSMFVMTGPDGRRRVVGKPDSVEVARNRWAAMAGGTGDLLTGHTVMRLANGTVTARSTGVCSTMIRFGKPSDRELDAYLATGEPLTVSGGFTLNWLGGWFVEGVDGDPSSVIGISLPLTRRLLSEVGVEVVDLWRALSAHSRGHRYVDSTQCPPIRQEVGVSLRKVLIANRGEIAVRVIRACRDAGLTSVAVYADPDRDAPFVRLADEAFALEGSTPADSYLAIDKLLDVAKRAGADSVHPGYGFLSENAAFAQAVQDAGLIWIGPDPQAIRDLGDKVTARHIAARAGAPLVPGTKEPVAGADEIIAFADEFGLPVAIKAAFGGGGRGLKVARTRDEIPELFESAVREAIAAFGRGECFVERYLDRPRHVEAQVIADKHGNVIVVGTRDCSLQRRHQKLVEEAPAPFLSDEQRATIHASAKAICKEAGYVGAGTVEYLVGTDGTISFLEVNTRLQVEHPVSEETAGLDLVREQFRIAAGERLRITEDPTPRGHSIEFRINGEDAGRNFLPAPGVVSRFVAPEGPGVRVDVGVESGSVIGGAFDSLLAKVIITGEDRAEALARARRALDEMVVEGMATVLPFHRAVIRDAAFIGDDTGFAVHTRWIETEFVNTIPPFEGAAEAGEAPERQTVVVEVGGRRLEVSLPGDLALGVGSAAPAASRAKPRKRAGGKQAAAVSGNAVTAPMQGTIVKAVVSDGQRVEAGELLLVLEAMKMENPVTAHKAGTVAGLAVAPGDAVTQGMVLLEITD